MPEVVTGSPGNQGSNLSGVGAVMFDSTVDPLTLHLHNLGVLDQAADQRKAAAATHLKNLADMATANNPDVTGIRPYDADRLKAEGAQVQDAFTNFLKTGGRLDTPQGIDANAKYQQTLNMLTHHIALSKDANSKLSSVFNAVDKDKGDKLDLGAVSSQYAQALTTPLEGLGSLDWSKMIVPNKDTDIAGAMSEWAKGLPTNETTKTGTVNGFQSTTSTKTRVTDADVEQIASGWRGTKMKDIINNSWDAQPLTVKDSYLKQARALTGDVTMAVSKAVDLYAKDWAKKQQMKEATMAIHGESEASKQAAKNARSGYEEWPHVLAAVATGDPSIMGVLPYSPPLTVAEMANGQTVPRGAQVYGTTAMNLFDLGKTPVQVPKFDPMTDKVIPGSFAVSEVPNHPTVVFLDKDNKIQMATVDSEENYRKGLQKSPYVGTGFNSIKDALYYVGATVKKSGKEEGLDPLTSMMDEIKRNKAIKPNGDIDPYVLNPMTEDKKKLRSEKAKGYVKYEELPVVGTKSPLQKDPLGLF